MRGGRACELELGRGTACSGDCFARAAAELVSVDVDLDGQLAVGKHLHQRVLAHRTGGHQLVDTHVAALGEQLVDVADVDDLVLGAEPVLESLELRQPHMDRHLAALERRRDVLARLGALRAAACGLALGALTATHPGLGGLRARRGLQVMQLYGHETSSTSTRWWTVLMSPRVCALSSRTTDCRILRRPSVRRLSRCFQRAPMVLRVWVIFSSAIAYADPALAAEAASASPSRRCRSMLGGATSSMGRPRRAATSSGR